MGFSSRMIWKREAHHGKRAYLRVNRGKQSSAMERKDLGQKHDSLSKPHLAELRLGFQRCNMRPLDSLRLGGWPSWPPKPLPIYLTIIWFLLFCSVFPSHFLSKVWDFVLQGSVKNLRSLHAKACFVPEQFLLLHGPLLPLHSALRGEKMGRKRSLCQRAVGWKGGVNLWSI